MSAQPRTTKDNPGRMPVISPAPNEHRSAGAGQQERVDMNDLSNEPIILTDPEDEGEYVPLSGFDWVFGSAVIVVAVLLVVGMAIVLNGLP